MLMAGVKVTIWDGGPLEELGPDASVFHLCSQRSTPFFVRCLYPKDQQTAYTFPYYHQLIVYAR